MNAEPDAIQSAQSAPQTGPVSRRTLWFGWTLTVLPVLALIPSSIMKFLMPPTVAEGFAHLGLPEHLAPGLGLLELGCTLVYLIPRTSVLGAILLTGYLGGATVTHLRVGDPFVMPVILDILVWGGVSLREPRLHALIPLRQGTTR